MNNIEKTRILELARRYNKLDKPKLESSAQLVGYLDFYHRARIFDEQESKEVCSALEKCAECYVLNKASDKQKYALGRCLKYFAIGHPENIPQVLNTLDKLTDVDVIDPIRSCMSRDPSLLDQGFTAMHKSVNAICKKENSNFAASEQIRLAFADLYSYFGQQDSVKTIDRITKEFPSFENQIQRSDAASLYNQCLPSGKESELMRLKLSILMETFFEFGDSNRSFTKIYNDMEKLYNPSRPAQINRRRGGINM